MNAALRRRDRAALERIFAEGYVWAHPSGYVDDRAAFLADELATDSAFQLGLTFAPPEEFFVYGDAALLRRPLHADPSLPMRSRPALSTWAFAKRDGRWRIVQTQGTLLHAERLPVPVAASLLEAYAGSYADGSGGRVVVAFEGERLVVRRPGSANPPRLLTPVSDSGFFDKLGNEHTFHRGPDGRITHLVLRLADGREMRRQRMP